jgi:Trk-type K+ transport system membrane component
LLGTVGLSLGYGTMPFSFCGVWSGGSKFILALIMILGKHRYVACVTCVLCAVDY